MRGGLTSFSFSSFPQDITVRARKTDQAEILFFIVKSFVVYGSEFAKKKPSASTLLPAVFFAGRTENMAGYPANYSVFYETQPVFTRRTDNSYQEYAIGMIPQVNNTTAAIWKVKDGFAV